MYKIQYSLSIQLAHKKVPPSNEPKIGLVYRHRHYTQGKFSSCLVRSHVLTIYFQD